MDYHYVLPVVVAGRLLISYSLHSDALLHNHQLSSPPTSYSRLQEGVYLFKNAINPYSGGLFHHSPLLLSLFSTVIPLSSAISPALWTLCDTLGAHCMVSIWRARSKLESSRRDGLIAALYLLNPYILLSSLALSTSTFENALYLLSLSFASQGSSSQALLCLAILTHLSLPSALLAAPIVMLLISGPESYLASPKAFTGDARKATRLCAEYLVYALSLTMISTVISDGWTWVPKTWGASLLLPDLTPNPGLWWYFFTEMFDHFRPFFLVVFSAHLVIYVAPLCIKFQHDPLYVTFLLQGILATFKPYPTLADPGLFLSTIALFPETYPYLRHPIVTVLLHVHASLLLPLFHHLWLGQGSGNANFFYASTLVFGMANGAALIDCAWAGLRIAFGEKVPGHEVVQK
ncbi:cell division cycle protein 91 [Rickenella mellea]|uniref:Cell division cycle protein 91 n=1 Tax=Rickenella mellea TaxID=50990 RepID=A0A4Y7QF78_9AGAM|nr:cell division cycle protein 91 [Rickenella mellea]